MNVHIDEIAWTIEMSKCVKRTSKTTTAIVMYRYVNRFCPCSVDGNYLEQF